MLDARRVDAHRYDAVPCLVRHRDEKDTEEEDGVNPAEGNGIIFKVRRETAMLTMNLVIGTWGG